MIRARNYVLALALLLPACAQAGDILGGVLGGQPVGGVNGGNVVARFVDLAPFPPSRSLFFSIDLGF